MGIYKKIGLSHEMGLIDTPPFTQQQSVWNWIQNRRMSSQITLFSLTRIFVRNFRVNMVAETGVLIPLTTGFGWLVVLGLTTLWDNILVYIGPSVKEGERKEKR